MVNKGVGSHGQFDRLYVLPVRDRDRPLHCRCFYLSGISLVQEMADIIVVLIVIVLLGFALRGAIRHFKGDSPCCGGGTGIIKTDDKELKNPVIGKKTVHIEGMTCEHCVQSVKKALNEIEGVSARVDLQKKEAVVSYDREIENDVLKKTVEKAGCFYNRVDTIGG